MTSARAPCTVLPLLSRRRPVGRRAHQRMTKLDADTELDQPGLDRRRRGFSSDREPLGRAPQEHRVANGSAAASCSSRRVSAGRASSRRRKLSSICPASGTAAGKRKPSRQLSRRRAPRQLQQRQRVAARLARRSDPSRARPRGPVNAESSSAEHRPRSSPSTRRSGNSARSSLGSTSREDQADRLGLQPTRHECEHLHRRLIKPLLVIDKTNQRLLLGDFREQAQHRQPDDKPVRRRPELTPNAVWSASRCGAGRRSSRSNIGAQQLM